MNWLKFFGLFYKIHSGKITELSQIESQGLLAVKIAQHLALRLDFFSVENCQKLSKLFSQETVHSPIPLDSLLTVDFQHHFKTISPIPFATASVGQVHKAKTMDGTAVVIKIIKQDYLKELRNDVNELRRFFKILEIFLPNFKNIFDPVAIIEYIESYTRQELQLTNEIHGTERLKKLKDQSQSFYNLERLAFPKHYPAFSSERIFVSEEIKGETFKKLLEQDKLSYENLLELFRIHGFYIFFHGEFHGDLHPGNIILAEDEKLYFIDTGAISTSSEKIRNHLLKMFLYLTNYDYPNAAIVLNSMSLTPLSEKKLSTFQDHFCNLYKDFQDKKVCELSLTKQMMNSIKLAIYSGMSFDQSMFPIIKSLSYLDGMVLRCNPQANLIKDMKPAVEQLMRLK